MKGTNEMQTVRPDATRKGELAMIHVAKKSLSLDDDAYRCILVEVTGKSSSAELDSAGRNALIDHFKKIGFKIKAKNAGRSRPAAVPARAGLITKIEAQLLAAGRTWSYADALAKRLCQIDRIDFCEAHQLIKIVAALSYDAKRHGRDKK
jgi:phage gp16-like protein